ncbi:MAG TPA: hypothetical protein VFD52_06320 [Clostridia bacterium]|nr:hypothetical protein [Clostridia bacterium]
MNKMFKRIISIVVAFSIVFSVSGLTVSPYAVKNNSGNSQPYVSNAVQSTRSSNLGDSLIDSFMRVFCNTLDVVVNVIIGEIVNLFPEVELESGEDYVNESFFVGHENFLTSPAQDAVWRLGYSSASIIPKNMMTKDYYFGGFMFPLEPARTIADDQRVRVICIDDGSGRGTTAFASIDAVGLGNGDVTAIRALLKDFARENNIVSINISCTHAHSCIDTQGLSGKFIVSAITNAVYTKYGFLNGKITSGRDEEFMSVLYSKTVQSVKDAFNSMKEGNLYFSTVDVSEYIRDKRDPQVFDPNINSLHFVPNDSSRDVWIANLGAHPTSLSRESTSISADFPHYMEQAVNEYANADFIFFQGAQGAIATNRGVFNTTGEMTGYEVMTAMGREFGRLMIQEGTQEVKLEPLFNIRHREVFVPATNPIMELVLKAQLVNNIAVNTENGPKIATEVGYAEFGTSLATAILPGEFFPEIVWGGTFGADKAWNKVEFDRPSIQEIIGENRKVVAFGLSNDAAGYVVPDNDYAPFIADFLGYDHYEETLSGGSQMASTIVDAFELLVNSTN